jgi:Holliday junction resolvasome RuvABC endonuclease subunit
MGLDCSTNSLAFSVFKEDNLIKYGEIFFKGDTVFQRAADARRKVEALTSQFDISFVAIEKTIFAKSIDTAIKMAYVAGTVISCLVENHAEVIEIAPISWQSGIGNPNLSMAEKTKLKKDFPGKSKTWYQNKGRELRKQKTKDWVKKQFGLTIESDNVTDAIGIGWVVSTKII